MKIIFLIYLITILFAPMKSYAENSYGIIPFHKEISQQIKEDMGSDYDDFEHTIKDIIIKKSNNINNIQYLWQEPSIDYSKENKTKLKNRLKQISKDKSINVFIFGSLKEEQNIFALSLETFSTSKDEFSTFPTQYLTETELIGIKAWFLNKVSIILNKTKIDETIHDITFLLSPSTKKIAACNDPIACLSGDKDTELKPEPALLKPKPAKPPTHTQISTPNPPPEPVIPSSSEVALSTLTETAENIAKISEATNGTSIEPIESKFNNLPWKTNAMDLTEIYDMLFREGFLAYYLDNLKNHEEVLEQVAKKYSGLSIDELKNDLINRWRSKETREESCSNTRVILFDTVGENSQETPASAPTLERHELCFEPAYLRVPSIQYEHQNYKNVCYYTNSGPEWKVEPHTQPLNIGKMQLRTYQESLDEIKRLNESDPQAKWRIPSIYELFIIRLGLKPSTEKNKALVYWSNTANKENLSEVWTLWYLEEPQPVGRKPFVDHFNKEEEEKKALLVPVRDCPTH